MAPKLTLLAALLFASAALSPSLIDQASAAPTPSRAAALTRRAPQVFVDGDEFGTGIGIGDSFVDVGRDSSIVNPGRDGVFVDRDNRNGFVSVDDGRNAAVVDQFIGDVEVFGAGNPNVQKRSPQVFVDGDEFGSGIGIGDSFVDVGRDSSIVNPGRDGVFVDRDNRNGFVSVDDGRNAAVVDQFIGDVEVFGAGNPKVQKRSPQVFVDGDEFGTGIGIGDSFVDVGRDSSIVNPGRDGVFVDRDNRNGFVSVDDGRNAAVVDQFIGDVEVFGAGKVQKRSPQVFVDGNNAGTRFGIDNGDSRVDIGPDTIDVIPGRNGVDIVDFPDEGLVFVDDGRNTSIVDEIDGTVEVFDA